ncbi:Secologanin synthase [Sesamum alatum]|uniref:Secologanin synthase n=1 Tax=Sesamum alatum TaxID=300844 RepID=A0AAE1Y3N5_9LAMI|nr:Secologanin synthase [Sesamum alatum]
MDVPVIVVGEPSLWRAIGFSLVAIVAVTWVWRVLDWVWFSPRRKERILRQQGFKGNSYTLMRLMFGDIKENSMVYAEALGKAINIHDPAAPRVMPFVHKTLQQYGMMNYFNFVVCFLFQGFLQ